MREAVICSPLRTPVGGYGGSLRDLEVTQLASLVVESVVERSGLPAQAVDDVVLGQCYANGEAPALGRVAALDAGLPVETPGLQLDRRCGSGLMAVLIGAMEVQTEAAEVVLAGGAESMSQAEFYLTGIRWGIRQGSRELRDRLERGRVTAGGKRHPVPGGMIETAENIRRRYSITREEQDGYALTSHQRAVAAQRSGVFDQEIVPVKWTGRKGEEHLVDRDEHPRADTSLEKLASLPPVMRATDAEATVTAGNASGQNDAASCCIVTSFEAAERYGLEPLLVLRGWAAAGVPPELMGLGPIPATAKLLSRLGLSLEDMDLIELNEAFAVQVLAVLREWGLKDGLERVNVNGSGISLGHPVGATGARILTTLAYEMQRRGSRLGLETMCIGGGQGLAAVFERVG